MNGKWIKLGVVAMVAALAGAAVLSAPAFAQGGAPATGSGGTGGHGAGMRGAWGGPNNSLVAVVAQVLAVDKAELFPDLVAGQTLAQIAEAHGVSLDTIVDAVLAPRVTWLNQAVAAGRLTQAQADTMLASMRTNVTAQLTAVHTPNSSGMGFVDADGDGVCDLNGAGRPRDRGGRWNR